MSKEQSPYASEEETRALIVPDTRTTAQKMLDRMLDERGAWEQGAEAYPVLYQIAIELLAEQPAPVQGEFDIRGMLASKLTCWGRLREVEENELVVLVTGLMHPAPVQQEPVAWVEVKDTHHGPYEFHGKELLPVGKHDLYTSPQPAQRKLLPQSEWPKHPSPYVGEEYVGYSISDLDSYAMQVLSAHGIKAAA